MAGSGSSQNRDADPPSALPSPREEEERDSAPRILVVEDNAADVFLIREALTAAGIGGHVYVVEDGETAIQFFQQADCEATAPCPDAVILDINLPKKKGGDVLRHLRTSSRCRAAKVVIVTSSNSDRDREEMDRLGSDAFFRKPSKYAEFMRLGRLVRMLVGLDEIGSR